MGFDHASAMPEVPPPDEAETTAERLSRLYGPAAEENSWPTPIDMRHVSALVAGQVPEPSPGSYRSLVWLRADGELPDDPLLHVCLMTYASDMTLLDTVLRAHRTSWTESVATGASLDHAMWFHRPFRADRWLLYVQDSPSASGARGLARGEVFTEEGQLVVSVVQEGLLRPHELA
jgi:acyl-CoA thioesterase-2